jgi:hypothetical protein
MFYFFILHFPRLNPRTSHVSGTVLDIGVTIGQMIRHRNLEGLWKIQVHGPNVVCYWIGRSFFSSSSFFFFFFFFFLLEASE